GSLWTSGGTRLAQATFSGETATGWQQVSFASPVAISANTTYVASYHTDTGHYAGDLNYFTGGVDRVPLHALASGSSGGNGVYAYSATSTFPNGTYNASNYWVDAVFTQSVGPTATPTATSTPAPPTATPTRTNTPLPPTATSTPGPPTATPTRTNTPVPP